MDEIIKLTHTGFQNADKLRQAMKPFYTERVLKKAADAKLRHSRTKWYCMRTARAYRATEWVKVVTEYRLMKWEPEPLNPLQHESEKMTMEHYALKGIDSKWEV